MGWFKDSIYAFKYRFVRKHRYHVVYTGLKPGYYCNDTRLLHACLACLCDFVDTDGEDKLDEFTEELKKDPQHEHQAKQQSEVLAIYRWWKRQKPKDEQEHDRLLDLAFDGEIEFEKVEGTEFSRMKYKEPTPEQTEAREKLEAIDKKIADDEQAMLHRLIDIRNALWD